MAERLVAVVDADVSGFLRGMSRVDSRLASTGRGMGVVSRGMVGLGRIGGAALLGVGAAAVTAGGALGVMGIKFGSMKQQALTSFKVLLGSGKAAQKMFNDLNRFAAKTPFEFPDLATAAQRMLAMGWSAKRIMPDLRAIGDAAAASPQGMVEGLSRITTAMGQMKAKGKASAEELMQLTEAGIPAWRFLADAAGKSVAEIQKDVEKGAVSSDQAISALLGGMRRKYGGMMKEQSKTLAGAWSTLKDTISQSTGAILEPMIPLLTRASVAVSNAFGSKDGKAAIKALGQGVEWIADRAGEAVKVFRENWPQIKSIARDVLGALTAYWSALWTAAQPIITGIAGTIERHWPRIREVATQVFGAVLGAVVKVVGWVGENWPRISEIIGTVLQTVVGAVAAVVSFFQANWPLISSVATQVWTQVLAYGQQFVAWVQDTLWPAVSSVVDMLVAVWQRWGDEIKTVFRGAVTVVSTAVQNIVTTLDALVRIVGTIAEAVTSAINGDWSGAWSKAKEAVSIAWEAIKEQAERIKTNIGPLLLDAGEWAVEQFKTGIGKRADEGLQVLEDLPGTIEGYASSVASAAIGLGESIATNVATGLAGLPGKVLELVTGAIKAGIGAFNSATVPRFSLRIPGFNIGSKKIAGQTVFPGFSWGGTTIGAGPFAIPDIPFGATGGRFASPAIIGEAGPEWVIPERGNRSNAVSLLLGAAKALGIPMFGEGRAPRLTPHAVNFKRWGRFGLSQREQYAQRYSDDTALYLRRWQRDGTMTRDEYGAYTGRMQTYRGMLMRLLGTYTVRANANVGKKPEKPGDGASDAEKKAYDRAKRAYDDRVARRDEAREKQRETRRAVLNIVEDIRDAQYESRGAPKEPPGPEPPAPPAPFSLDQIAGLTSVDEQLAIAEAGLGGNTTALLKKKRDILKAAFDRSRSQSERAIIARELASVDSALGSASPSLGGGGGGGGGDAISSGGGGGGSVQNITNTLNLTVEGNVATERDLAEAIRRIVIEWGRTGQAPVFAGYA